MKLSEQGKNTKHQIILKVFFLSSFFFYIVSQAVATGSSNNATVTGIKLNLSPASDIRHTALGTDLLAIISQSQRKTAISFLLFLTQWT